MDITIVFETSWYLNGKDIRINRHLTKLLSAMKFDAGDYIGVLYKRRERKSHKKQQRYFIINSNKMNTEFAYGVGCKSLTRVEKKNITVFEEKHRIDERIKNKKNAKKRVSRQI